MRALWGTSTTSPPTLVGFNVAVTSCARTSRWEAGLGILDSMCWALLEVPAVAFGAAVAAVATQREHWTLVLEMLGSTVLSKRTPASIPLHAFAAALDVATWNRALGLLSAMNSQDLQLDLTTCNSALQALSSRWLRALGFMSEMTGSGHLQVPPDMLSWVCISDACEKAGRYLWLSWLSACLSAVAALAFKRVRLD